MRGFPPRITIFSKSKLSPFICGQMPASQTRAKGPEGGGRGGRKEAAALRPPGRDSPSGMLLQSFLLWPPGGLLCLLGRQKPVTSRKRAQRPFPVNQIIVYHLCRLLKRECGAFFGGSSRAGAP
ncbi:hypothetical protein HMPREF0262_03233 [Clostridium sp. ATCC 29733]|nr:hypothetical protein HMPREF0262_03233 [Clostridium sp. ATCC 29733]